MPQFLFSAADQFGNQIDGTVIAGDLLSAGEQVRLMGYSPLKLEISNTSAASLDPTLLSEPALNAGMMDTSPSPSLPTQQAAELTPQRTFLGDPTAQQDEARREPWERGGALPQQDAPKATMNAMGSVVRIASPASAIPISAASQKEVAGGLEKGRITRIPYSKADRPQQSLGRRLTELIVYPVVSGVVIKDLAAWYRQFATLIGAGLTLYRALSALEENTKNPKLKEIAREASKQVEAGGKLSDVMAAYPWVFSPMNMEMIRASEEGGMIDQVLLHLADYVEHELEIRRMISRETMYPKIVLFVAVMIMGRTGLTGGPLAVVDLVLNSNGAGYLANTVGFGGAILLAIFATYATFRLFLFNMPGVREGYDMFKLKIPVIGNIVKMFALARFARAFAALYRGGFTIPSALDIAGRASGNAVIEKVARDAVRVAEHGGLVSEQIRRTGIFPPMIMDMFQTGESTGNLDTMMDKSADFFESEAKVKSHQAALVFGVFIFLCVAIMVGFSVISGYTGLAHQSTTVPE